MYESNLKDSPVTFELDGFDAIFTLSHNGKELSDQLYILTVDGVAFGALPEYKDVVEVPKIGHSVIEEHHSANTRRIDWPVFLNGKRTPVSVEHNMRSGFVTLDVCGKPQKSW